MLNDCGLTNNDMYRAVGVQLLQGLRQLSCATGKFYKLLFEHVMLPFKDIFLLRNTFQLHVLFK